VGAAAAAGLVRSASRPAGGGAHGAREQRRPDQYRRTREGETATAPAAAAPDGGTPALQAQNLIISVLLRFLAVGWT